MARKIVWEMADGSVRVTSPSPKHNSDDDKVLEDVAQRVIRKDEAGDFARAQRHFFVDKTVSDGWRVAAKLESERVSKQARNAWRLDVTKTAVVIDPVELGKLPVITEPLIGADLTAAIDGASSLAQLKTVLKQALRT